MTRQCSHVSQSPKRRGKDRFEPQLQTITRLLRPSLRLNVNGTYPNKESLAGHLLNIVHLNYLNGGSLQLAVKKNDMVFQVHVTSHGH